MRLTSPIELSCSHCKQSIQLPAAVLGKYGQCHSCKHVGVIELVGETAGGSSARPIPAILVGPPETETGSQPMNPGLDSPRTGISPPNTDASRPGVPALLQNTRTGNSSSWNFNVKNASIIIGASALVCIAALWFVLTNTVSDNDISKDDQQSVPPSDLTTPIQLLQIAAAQFSDPLKEARQQNRIANAQLATGHRTQGLATLDNSKGLALAIPEGRMRAENTFNPYPPFEDKILVLNKIALIQFKAGSRQEALSTLELVSSELRTREFIDINWYGPRSQVAVELAQAGQFDEALKMAFEIYSTLNRVQVLIDIASVQVAMGHRFQALTTLTSAETATRRLPPEHNKDGFRADIAVLFSDAGHFIQANDITKLPGMDAFPEALSHLCSSLARSGRKVHAEREFKRIKSDYWRLKTRLDLIKYVHPDLPAAEAISHLEDIETRAGRLSGQIQQAQLHLKIGHSWMAIDEDPRASESVTRGVTAVTELPATRRRTDILTKLASLSVQLGDYNGAIAIAGNQIDPSRRAEALKHISVTMRDLGADDRAKSTLELAFQEARGLPDSQIRQSLVATIIRLQCQLGDYDKAIDFTEDISPASHKALPWFEIALCLATTGPATEDAGEPCALDMTRPLKASFTAKEDLLVARLLDRMREK